MEQYSIETVVLNQLTQKFTYQPKEVYNSKAQAYEEFGKKVANILEEGYFEKNRITDTDDYLERYYTNGYFTIIYIVEPYSAGSDPEEN